MRISKFNSSLYVSGALTQSLTEPVEVNVKSIIQICVDCWLFTRDKLSFILIPSPSPNNATDNILFQISRLWKIVNNNGFKLDSKYDTVLHFRIKS